ncbi:hypothetical protein FT096_08210 [Salmonella enterica subsp. enterica]|uniref:hypothetical protein n=1 Tax=Salmonella enterica TaxID=28901 RepID=UPI00126D6EA3|nr:hypothetical protein [Salmonella enterica]EBS2232018.1 hypothetical protein [Salmonella enterica subsp. enterica serovar Middlesbrough]EBW9544368.1 hypothetical protein [Salmonella enterica subsp. enterica serovar Mississippi]EBY6473970.1 hypothetical protein [Salmonella enterica subsp. enterica serovar Hessarek]ECL8866246.1 hypothetical protein [Salmonella enterica subsp. enterica serovar Ibadan]EDU3844911.1 hypothetical protein [Salmonella enterica subsp. enterica serovar Essen]EEJ028450
MSEKKHGLIGNKNAAKAKTASTQLQIRVNPEEKKQFVAIAQASGMTLSAWALTAMTEYANKFKN